ncbi:MAG TPA: hypothetical protein VMX15_06500 [Candidatus Heimdallarchaeota archaeon]|nr:hypothetical protein [Candidatus Heimdallarchaeota archaeon]
MADQDVVTSEAEAGSEASEAVTGSDSTQPDGGTVADSLFTGGPFKFGWHDGTQWEIKDRAQLARELGKVNEERRHSTMRHEDLKSERQKVAEQQRLMDQAIKKARDAEERANSSYGRYKPWDELMVQNPPLQKRVEEIIDEFRGNGKHNGDVTALKEALKNDPEFQEFMSVKDEWKKDREARTQEKAVADAVAQLKSEIADYDDEAVSSFLSDLAKVPKADGERTLRKIIHYSLLGQERAGLLERKQATLGRRPGVSSTPGKPTTGPDLNEISEEEREAEIIRRLKEIPEE